MNKKELPATVNEAYNTVDNAIGALEEVIIELKKTRNALEEVPQDADEIIDDKEDE